MVTWSSIDTWMVLNAITIAISSTCIGSHFVLNRESLMSDAISHSVLPGIALAYIISGTRVGVLLFVWAIIVGVLATVLIDIIIKNANLDASTSMGVVFSGFFALGLLLLANVSRTVDLDPSCVLFGSLELTPLETASIFGLEIPISFITNGSIMLINIAFLFLALRMLTVLTFDRHFAVSIGVPVRILRIIQIVLLTVTTVAAFESVGSILIIALLIIPPVIGWLFSHTIKTLLIISFSAALLSSVLGHVAAIYIPPLFGIDDVSSTGSIVTVLGFFLLTGLLCSPRMGLVLLLINKIKNQIAIASSDILKNMHQHPLQKYRRIHDFREIQAQSLVAGKLTLFSIMRALKLLLREKYIAYDAASGYTITKLGKDKARQIITRHRSWERFLFAEGMDPNELHLSAEQLEHSVQTVSSKDSIPVKPKIPGHSHA